MSSIATWSRMTPALPGLRAAWAERRPGSLLCAAQDGRPSMPLALRHYLQPGAGAAGRAAAGAHSVHRRYADAGRHRGAQPGELPAHAGLYRRRRLEPSRPRSRSQGDLMVANRWGALADFVRLGRDRTASAVRRAHGTADRPGQDLPGRARPQRQGDRRGARGRPSSARCAPPWARRFDEAALPCGVRLRSTCPPTIPLLPTTRTIWPTSA